MNKVIKKELQSYTEVQLNTIKSEASRTLFQNMLDLGCVCVNESVSSNKDIGDGIYVSFNKNINAENFFLSFKLLSEGSYYEYSFHLDLGDSCTGKYTSFRTTLKSCYVFALPIEYNGSVEPRDAVESVGKSWIDDIVRLNKDVKIEFLQHLSGSNVVLKEVQEADCDTKEYDYINPNHYKQFSKETIDMMVSIWGKEAVATHCEITAFKYKRRVGSKPEQPIERDMEKANWYLNKAKELRG